LWNRLDVHLAANQCLLYLCSHEYVYVVREFVRSRPDDVVLVDLVDSFVRVPGGDVIELREVLTEYREHQLPEGLGPADVVLPESGL
jgi:hypothetical protein